MSRKPIIAGNWKMNKTLKKQKAFVEAVASKLPSTDLVDVAVAAPAVDLVTTIEAAKDSVLKVAAQNCYFENTGHSLVKHHQKCLLKWELTML